MVDREHDYTVEHGIIKNPGKFEGEPIYVPYFYDMAGEGFGDTHYDGELAVDFFIIDDEDRAKYPRSDGKHPRAELADGYGLAIWESDQGFVNCEVFDTQEAYEQMIADLDASTGDEETE